MSKLNIIKRILSDLKKSKNKDVLESALQSYEEEELEIKDFLARTFHELSGQKKSPKEEVAAEQSYTSIAGNLNFLNRQKKNEAKAGGIHRLLQWKNIAAAILLFSVASFLLRLTVYKDKVPTDGKKTFIASAIKTTVMDTIFNNGNAIVKYHLPDWSCVDLYPNSFVAFKKNLIGKQKLVYLTGEAIFSVKKHEGTIFSVISNGFEIRDLGTIFSVNTNKGNLKVKLIKGKVIVHRMALQIKMQDIPLHPGQTFEWNEKEGQYALSINKADSPVPNNIVRKNKIEDKKRLAIVELGTSYNFKNARLEDVLDSLNSSFKSVKISYNKKDIQGKSFTGELLEGSKLPYILQIICRPHSGLKYNIKEDKIFIDSNTKEQIIY